MGAIIRPPTNPEAWAMKAIPPIKCSEAICVIEYELLKTCKINQYPKNKNAGIFRIVIKKKIGINVSTSA